MLNKMFVNYNKKLYRLIAKCTIVFVAHKIHVQFVRFIILQIFKTSTMYGFNQILCTIFFFKKIYKLVPNLKNLVVKNL